MHRLSSFDLALVALYLAGITLFGLRFRSRDRSLTHYFLADRRIPWWAIALSIVAAETSTLTIISVPGLAYTGDWGFLEIVLGYLLGRIVVCIIFLPRYFRGELLTAYEVIGQRFGPRLHKLTAFLFLFLRAAAEGVRVFAVSIVVGIAIGTRDVISIAIICALTLIYTLEGGMAAVIWTDVVQMGLYIAGTIVSVILLGHRIPGGWHAIHTVAAAAGKLTIFHFALSLSVTYTFWAGLAGGCFLTMASHGTDQLMVQRLLAAKNLRDSRIALLSSGGVILIQFALFLAIGTGLYYFYGAQGATLGGPDRIFPQFIVTQMPPGVAGLMVAAILAAAMSNLSAAVNSLSSSSMVDFYMAWKPDADERQRARLSRVMTFFWAMLLFVLALMSRGGGHVVEVGLSIASVAYGALLGVFLLGTLTKSATEAGAMIGMIGGLVANILLWRQPHWLPLPKIAWTWFVLIGSLLTFVLGWGMSRILPGKKRYAVLLLVFLAPRLKAQDAEFRQIDRIVEGGIEARKFPGAVVIAGHNGRIIFHKAYGNSSLIPSPEPMTEDTIFDLASLTKVLVTAPAIMQLYQQGRFRLNDPVAEYLPEFAVNGKQDITIRQLLTHYSGLPPDVSLDDAWEGKQEGLRRAFTAKPVTAPGVQFRYSDINFIVLGALVEKLSGLTLDQYQQHYLAQPLGVEHMRFLPPESWRSRIAPTQYDHGVMLRGVVHDPTSRRMGGVAGHAGLFSTAGDVAVYAQNLLDALAGRPSRFPLQQLTLEKMTTPGQPATGTALRGLGWDIESPYSSNRGELFPVGSFGHTGFTGTSIWMDPTSDTYVVFMSNAVYPNGPTGINAIRGAVANAVATWVQLQPDHGSLAAQLTGYNESIAGERRRQDRNGDVATGIDVLEEDNFAPLAALAARHGGTLRLGLLTNQTGLDAQGRTTIDILARDAAAAVSGLQLKLIFSPEHGIHGTLDKEGIEDEKDPSTGLPVISLYGDRRRPSLETLRGLDAVLIDIQDAGVRFYTYETVVRYFLEAAGQTGTDIVLLDRPNPIGGGFVQGPISDPGRESYVNVAPIPVRHGMTLGELARYFNEEYKLRAPLTVIAMRGWQRGDWFDATGLTWTNPSPNLRSLPEATLYPALGLIETTNISVGRGTDTPFEYVGAPWMDGPELAHALNARFLPGVRFLPVDFTPQSPYPYAGQLCHGVDLVVTDRNVVDSPELGLEIAAAIYKLFGDKFQLNKIDTLLVNKSILDQLLAGRDPQRIAEGWQQQLQDFEAKRKPYLLY